MTWEQQSSALLPVLIVLFWFLVHTQKCSLASVLRNQSWRWLGTIWDTLPLCGAILCHMRSWGSSCETCKISHLILILLFGKILVLVLPTSVLVLCLLFGFPPSIFSHVRTTGKTKSNVFKKLLLALDICDRHSTYHLSHFPNSLSVPSKLQCITWFYHSLQLDHISLSLNIAPSSF